ncbi:bacteriocin [Flavobacterium sp. GA093]|uniref:Bacteriocin n=1 Tax=Flavobacterium hydrocarbonoxydans TaxID=2683249 RepID=A0A6I4NXS0_9FLAO|nr:class I lanthipeptide [Flavobacterium hydrocarbonoxydans]MWB96549.1 bacteriocin [Flavobacterium hydrocarbonoxydans]
MKKQSSNNKLAFNKAAVAELNENQLNNINGGIEESRNLIRTIIITTGYGSWLTVV